jgi:hypothetical protein
VHPLEFFILNIQAFWDWTSKYMTWPLLILVALSFFIAKSYTKEKIVLFLWFIIPMVALGLFGRTLYPRYIFFMLLPLLPLIAYSLVNIYIKIKKSYLFAIFVFLIFILALKTDYLILTDFAKAYIPGSDTQQYLTAWPAGTGVKESIEFFKKEAEKGKIYIATEGTFGLMPYAFEIYLINNPNIKIEGYWPMEDKIPAKVIEESKKNPTYFFFYQPCSSCEDIGVAPAPWGIKPIIQFRGGRNNYTSIYRIK